MDVEPFDDFVDCLEVDLVEGDSDGEIETEIEDLREKVVSWAEAGRKLISKYREETTDLPAAQLPNNIERVKEKESIGSVNATVCDQCEYVAKGPLALETHMKTKHDGVLYSCDQCDYEGARSINLRRHKLREHASPPKPEGDKKRRRKQSRSSGQGETRESDLSVAPPPSNAIELDEDSESNDADNKICDQCEYVATGFMGLETHMKTKHEVVLYPCDQCDYEAARSFSLKQHKLKHGEKQGGRLKKNSGSYEPTAFVEKQLGALQGSVNTRSAPQVIGDDGPPEIKNVRKDRKDKGISRGTVRGEDSLFDMFSRNTTSRVSKQRKKAGVKFYSYGKKD